jgi:hypothetical protein
LFVEDGVFGLDKIFGRLECPANFFFLAQWEGVKATRCRATTKNVGVPASAEGKTSTEKKEKTDSRKKLFQRRRRWWTTGLNIFFGPP